MRGGLWDAIAEARAQAGIDPDADLAIEYFGTLGALSGLQRLIGGVFGFADAVADSQGHGQPFGPSGGGPPIPPELRELGQVYGALATKGPLALMPYTLSID